MLSTLRYILFPVLHVSGPVFAAFSLVMLFPLAFSYLSQDGATNGFLIAAGITFFVGVFLRIVSYRDSRELVSRDGFLLATLIWTFVPLFASIPLYCAVPDITFVQAYFEAMSGTTTTCATVLSNLDTLPQSINLWRCLLCWLGGMGILVLAVAILPLLGVGGAQMFRAESSGPMKESKLTPRIADTAKGLWWIYLGLTLICALAYQMAGMTPFDALVHSFTTVSLGGFSSHDASFGFWNSPAIETVASIFIIFCGISFSSHFIAWRRKTLKCYFTNPECMAWIFLCFSSVAAVTVILYENHYYPTWSEAFRFALFNTLSTISTTGFANTDFNLWPIAAPVLMLSLACFASCGGSTGGGIKLMRAIILIKQSFSEFSLLLNPRSVVTVRIAGRLISDSVIHQTMAFLLIWIGLAVTVSIVLMITGLDLLTATSVAISCITNLGPALGQAGPASNFAFLTAPQLWICIVCMLLGRLELMTVIILFSRSFWRP